MQAMMIRAIALIGLFALAMQADPAGARKVIRGPVPSVSAAEIPLTFIDTELDARCRAGAADACLELGQTYLEGKEVFRNLLVARILLREACALGSADGCAGLAATDEGSPEAWSEAETPEQLFRRACDAGSLAGCAGLANALYGASDDANDRPAALSLARETCARGSDAMCLAHARWTLAEGALDEQVAESKARIAELCATRTYLDACWEAIAIATSREVVDEAEVSSANRMACRAGLARACLDEAERMVDDRSRPEDRAGVSSLLERACALDASHCATADYYREEPTLRAECSRGDMVACGRVGAMIHGGVAFAPALADYDEATGLLRQACLAGVQEHCSLAALHLRHPAPAPGTQSGFDAIRVFELACDEARPETCRFLARALLDGELIEPDPMRAAALFARACAAGDLPSCDDASPFAGIEPEVELADADHAFIAPLEPGEDTGRPLRRSEGPRSAMLFDCERSRLMFRGTIYVDMRCGSRARGLMSYELRPGQAPWQALLWRPPVVGGQRASLAGRVLCGGSVIARGWILTAAHCLSEIGSSRITPGYKVRLGVHNPRASEGVSYPIIRTISHPGFNPRNYAFDIGLVRYDHRQPSQEGPVNAIRTIALDPLPIGERRVDPSVTVYGYGWGWTEANDSSTTDNLRGFKMQLTSEAECTRITNFQNDRLNSSLCAGGADGAQACLGDSGGPLIYYGDEDRVPRIIGVISAGKKCGTLGEVSRYTRVAKVRAWIAEQMRRYSAD